MVEPTDRELAGRTRSEDIRSEAGLQNPARNDSCRRIGREGLYRVMNSIKIERVAAHRLSRGVRDVRLRGGYALHTLILASKVK